MNYMGMQTKSCGLRMSEEEQLKNSTDDELAAAYVENVLARAATEHVGRINRLFDTCGKIARDLKHAAPHGRCWNSSLRIAIPRFAAQFNRLSNGLITKAGRHRRVFRRERSICGKATIPRCRQ